MKHKSAAFFYITGILLMVFSCTTTNTEETKVTINTSNQNPNFHIYICFGQSNMEGAGKIEQQDRQVNERFQVMYTSKYKKGNKSKGNWYPAVPPLCYSYAGLSPADYFGRTMVENLPEHIRVGVINVSVSGCDIRLFDKDLYKNYDATYKEDWFKDRIQYYDGNPYKYLIDLANRAQADGVIKGILLHQGETNSGDTKWPSYVKKIYTDMLNDLSLDSASVPLLAGELYSGSDSVYAGMNKIINTLPDVIPNAHVISSEGCGVFDGTHFDSEGYRKFGRHYAEKMLTLLD